MQRSFASAKKIMEFYQAKLEDDDRPECQYAIQYGGLRMARYRMSCVHDSLSTYPLTVSTE